MNESPEVTVAIKKIFDLLEELSLRATDLQTCYMLVELTKQISIVTK